jgi:hypothetical protein
MFINNPYFPRKKTLVKKGYPKFIANFSLEDLYSLAKQGDDVAINFLIKEYKMRIYTEEQLKKLNKAVKLIKEVMENK